MNLEFSFSLGMSCPSWQWHKTGYRWSPVRTIPVAPLWCDLGRCSRTVVVIKLRRISALQAQFVACDEIFVSQRYPQELRDLWSQRTRFLHTWSSVHLFPTVAFSATLLVNPDLYLLKHFLLRCRPVAKKSSRFCTLGERVRVGRPRPVRWQGRGRHVRVLPAYNRAQCVQQAKCGSPTLPPSLSLSLSLSLSPSLSLSLTYDSGERSSYTSVVGLIGMKP